VYASKQLKAIRYLRSLGIGYKTIKKYKIGFCDSSLAHALVKKINPGDETLKNEMSDAGLLQFIAQRGIEGAVAAWGCLKIITKSKKK